MGCMTLVFLVLTVNGSKRIRVSQEDLFFWCLCLGRIQESLELFQETHGLLRFPDEWQLDNNKEFVFAV